MPSWLIFGIYAWKNLGYGLFARSLIQKDATIIEYCGDVVPYEEFEMRHETVYKNDKHRFYMQLDEEYVIDSREIGTDARTINHSCNPNCILQWWTVDGHRRIVVIASREIQPGEELTYNYHLYNFNVPNFHQFTCKCKEENCCQTIYY